MIRLLTYSTKPRGGVVHALYLAEALADRGNDVELWALAIDGAGFFREPRVTTRLVPVGRRSGEDVETRILRYADALAAGLREAGPAAVHHAEDCLSARALLRLRGEGRVAEIIRTIHHVDHFQSQVLTDCQTASIVDVDRRICVSRYWADRLAREFQVSAEVIPNGVDHGRYAAPGLTRAAARARFGWGERAVILTVGGIEPRKGSRDLLRAFAAARPGLGPAPLLAIAGGETLFDYRDYRAGWWEDAAALGLRVAERPDADADVAILGRVADPDMPALYRGADALALPSLREGFGLVAVEAMAAGCPVVVSDLEVFKEFLRPGEDCLMVAVGDRPALAAALRRAVRDRPLRRRLALAGPGTAAGFSWDAAAAAHERIYAGADVLA